MSDDIKPGDMVELISGSATMVVLSVSKQETRVAPSPLTKLRQEIPPSAAAMADVVWWKDDSAHGFQRDTLPVLALRKRHVRQLEGDPKKPGFCLEASFDRNLLDAIERNADAVREAIAKHGPVHRRADDHVHQVDIEPEMILAVLRSLEGRGAIADVMARPPMRMPDGTYCEWPEPGKERPARDAKPGDWVQNRHTRKTYRVIRTRPNIDGIQLSADDGETHIGRLDDYILLSGERSSSGKWSDKPEDKP